MDVADLAFPRHLHRWQGLYLRVNTAAECAAALAAGWALLPPQAPPVDTPPEPAPPVRKGGRPARA
jgi:hypothetical protein